MCGTSDSSRDEFSSFSANVSEVELRAAQIAQLYSQVYTGMIAAIVAACALTVLLWDSVPRERLLLWTAVFLVVQIPRHLLLRRFQREQPKGAEVLPWGTWFLAGSVVTALLLGISTVFMFPRDNFVDQCVLATFLGGFAASTAVAHAPLKECYVSSVLLTLLPLIGRFLYQGGESGYILAAFGLVFTGALLGTGNALQRMIATSIRLRFQRDETIRNLEHARGALEDRVAERTAELQAINDRLMLEMGERKRAEEELLESEEKFKLIVEGAPEAVFVQTGGLFTYLNDQALRLFGAEHTEDLLGKPVLDRFHPWFHEVIRERIRLLNTEKQSVPSMEQIYLRMDGSEINVEVSAVPIRFENKDGALIFARDITERREMVEALRESEERFRIAFQTSPDAISISRMQDGLYVDVNEAFSELSGFSKDEVIGKTALDINIWNNPEDRTLLLKGLKQSGHVGNFEAQYRLKDGRVRAGLMSARTIILNGEPHILSVTRDVEDWKSAQEALLESERKYKDLFEYSNDLNYTHDLKGNLTSVNEAVTRILGYTSQELLNFNVRSIIDPSHQALTEKRFREQLEKVVDRSGPYEVLARAKDGHPVWLEFTNRLIKHGENVTGVHGTARDITFRKEAEAERSRLVTAIEQAGESIVITDTEANILYVNPAFEATTGFTREEAIGENPKILRSGKQDKAFYADMWETLGRGEVWRGRFTNKRKNGTLYEETATISPIKDATGQIVNYVAVKRDVTAELTLQKQLLHSQKMEAIGTLAGGIAHDVNNLLQAVLGYSDLLLMKKGPSDPDRRKLEVIQQAARDGADLVARILAFSRKGESKSRPVDLNDEIRKSEKLLRRMLPRMIEIDLLLADDIGIIEVDPAQLEQVILNLGVNAQHAMPNGGRLILETSNVSLNDEYIRTHLGAKKGKYVLFNISDTGVGIDPAILERIFEPFFTTKPNGLGTGLGLSTVHGIVTQHGGYITCYSEPGRGTSFKIYFPVSSRQVAFDASLTREMPAFGTETILLVDDDDRIREMGRQMIEMGGYKVLIARSGEEALEIYTSHTEDIALIILDLIMPGMGGSRCLEELLRIKPEVRVLVASGYSPNGQEQWQESSRARGFVNKPYDAKEILTAIRKVIDEGTFSLRKQSGPEP